MIPNLSLTLNEVTDKQLSLIFEFKSSRPGQFNLTPATIQQGGASGNPPTQRYDNVVLTCSGNTNIKSVVDFVLAL